MKIKRSRKEKKTVGTQTQTQAQEDGVIFIRKIPSHPRERLKGKTTRLRCWFYLFFQMEVLLTDYKTKYQIDENDEILKSLDQHDYYTYKIICGLAIDSFVVSYQKWFDVEIDAKQNEQLLKDITTKFYTNSLSSRWVEKKFVMDME